MQVVVLVTSAVMQLIMVLAFHCAILVIFSV